MPQLPVLRLWEDFRRSPTLVVTVVFVAMMLDLVLLTALEPILPSILYNMRLEKLEEAINGSVGYSFNVTPADFWSQDPEIRSRSRQEAMSEVNIQDTTGDAGVLLAVKPGAEIVANIFVGFIVDRFGHKTPMIAGCFCNVIATFAFAYVNTFWMLVTARVMQAIGSSLSVVSGLALLACFFKDERERTWANGIAFGGLSVGIIVGFPLGSTCYEFLGRPAPFLIMAGLMFMDAVLRMIIVTPSDLVTSTQREKLFSFASWFTLLFDPYISLALGCNLFLHVGLGMVVATEAAWMIGQLGGQPWHIGVVLVIGAISQFGVQFLTGMYSVRLGRWFFCWMGLMLSAIGYILYPFCVTVWQVVGPECVCRAGLGAMMAAISPLLAFIADSRHDSNYGAIYGLYAASYNLGLVIGPLAGGLLMHIIGFDWMYRAMGIFMVAYSFCCFSFRKIERKHLHTACPEKTGLLQKEKAYGTADRDNVTEGREEEACNV